MNWYNVVCALVAVVVTGCAVLHLVTKKDSSVLRKFVRSSIWLFLLWMIVTANKVNPTAHQGFYWTAISLGVCGFSRLLYNLRVLAYDIKKVEEISLTFHRKMIQGIYSRKTLGYMSLMAFFSAYSVWITAVYFKTF